MKDRKNIEEKDLDKLLSNLFLEENSIEADESSARFILGQEYDVKINPDKEKKLLKRLGRNPNGSGGYWNYLMIMIIAVTGGGAIIFYNNIASEKNNLQSPSYKNENKNHVINSENLAASLSANDSLNLSKVIDNVSPQLKTPFVVDTNDLKRSPNFPTSAVPGYFPKPDLKENKIVVKDFSPTEQALILYSKVKNKMLEKLLNLDKGVCTVVEESKIQYHGDALDIDPFILRNQAVTNLEYKIFLVDLVKEGRTEEYQKAVVHNELWNNYNDNILASTYFQDDKYNDFPVANISAEAALLFCSWLERELNQYSQRVNPKAKPLKIRLPFDSEWIFATRRGYVHIPDCGGYNTIYDIKEGIVDMSYINRIALIKRRGESKRTELDELFSINRYGMQENKILELFEKGFSYKGKPIKDSLYPNRMDVYSKAAHVSEITWEQGTNKIIIVGSCWKNKQEYLKMVSEFNKESASPFVGFRIVMINDNKASYKNPFW